MSNVIYTNQIQIAMQPLDFSLLINVALPNGEIENKAIVYLSPQHAKSLLHVLADNVKNYEEIFGKINLEASAEKLEDLAARGVIKIESGEPR